MTWEGVPWFVDGGEHSPEVARLLAYCATAAGEGVVGKGDCKVTASAIPDSNVHIAPGGVVALNRFAGGSSQTYLLRNVGDEVKALTPQGSSGVRYDLVAVIVEDPQYAGQPEPASIADGPYLKTVVYSNVPAATRFLSDVDADQSGYALALVKFDASDGTVNPADITDLRELATPRTKTEVYMQQHNATSQTPAALALHPSTASKSIKVPSWASHVQLKATISGIQGVDGGAGNGFAAVYLEARLGTLRTNQTMYRFDAAAVSKPVGATIVVCDEIAVPDALKGTSQTLASYMQANITQMTVQSTVNTSVILEATFIERTA